MGGWKPGKDWQKTSNSQKNFFPKVYKLSAIVFYTPAKGKVLLRYSQYKTGALNDPLNLINIWFQFWDLFYLLDIRKFKMTYEMITGQISMIPSASPTVQPAAITILAWKLF